MSKKDASIEIAVLEADSKSRTVYERVADYLTAQDWTYSSYPEKQYHSFNIRLKHGSVRVVVDSAEGAGWERILVYAVYPTFVPEPRRVAVSDALNRINYAVGFGNFEMDAKDGEVRTRTWLETDLSLGESQIERAIRKAVDLADQYQAALLAIAFGNALAENILELGSASEGQTVQ